MPDTAVAFGSTCKNCKLRKQNCFCNLPLEALIELDRIKEIRTFARRETLFNEGRPVDEVTIVCDGTAALTFSSSVGNAILLGLSERGEVLGLSSAVSGHPHEVSAQALDNIRVATVPRGQFLNFLERFPAASANARRELGHKVNRAYERIRLSAPGLSVRQKLAAWLLHMQEVRSDAKELFKVAMTHERIAQLLGVSRESVTRVLSELKRRGVVETRGIHFHISDSAYLNELLHRARRGL